jgi:Leucine-rich repeat (LRR) protein
MTGMKITITKSNINDYSKEIFDDIIYIKWRAGKIPIFNVGNVSIIKNFPNLQKLDCYNNQMTSLDSLANHFNLLKIDCGINNIISLDPLVNCINLQKLKCRCNEITSLDPLVNCINLQVLCCGGNQIISLKPLAHCINLQLLSCQRNQIISLKLGFGRDFVASKAQVNPARGNHWLIVSIYKN